MANNYNGNRNGFTKEEVIHNLTDLAIEMSLSGIILSMDTPSLANNLVNLIDESYGITEIDHIYIYPKYEKGIISDFGVVMYFAAGRNGEGNISRNSARSNNRNNNNDIDLTQFVSNKMTTGGFSTTQNFKSKIAPLSELDRDGNLVIRADKDRPEIAMIDGDFFKLMSLALKIGNNDPYDFQIVSCDPLNNKKDCVDYRLQIIKEVVPTKKKSKRNNSINYDYRDRMIAQRYGKH